MSGRVLIIGGTGQVGTASARLLVDDGWSVTVAHRGPPGRVPGTASVRVDRQDDAAMDRLLAEGFDVVVDLLAFRGTHSAQVLRNAGTIGSVIMMSSAAVYRDAAGRTLQEVGDAASAPVFDGPVEEDDDTVAPDDETYAGRKRAIELALLESAIPATILRPAGIHGPSSPQPREWFYIRRILDGRRTFVLGYGGRSSLHPVAVDNLAEMIALAARRPGAGVLNAGDPGLPDESEIAAAIVAAMGAEVAQVVVEDMPPIASPWSLPSPFLLSTRRAEEVLGYRSAATYREAVRRSVDSILSDHRAGLLEARLSDRFGPAELGCQVFVGMSKAPFDYAIEDRVIADLVGR